MFNPLNYILRLLTNKVFAILINGLFLISLLLNGFFIYLYGYSHILEKAINFFK